MWFIPISAPGGKTAASKQSAVHRNRVRSSSFSLYCQINEMKMHGGGLVLLFIFFIFIFSGEGRGATYACGLENSLYVSWRKESHILHKS